MRLKKLIGLAGMFLLASGVSAWAQSLPIRVSINGGTPTHHPADEAFSITIPGTITDLVTIHIYDKNSLNANGGVSAYSIGAITINGTVGTGSPLVEVLIADGDNYSFPQLPVTDMDIGCVSFGGLSFNSTSLRDISRVAAAVGGDITGSISAGAVRRIQARGRFIENPDPNEDDIYVGGKITGNITATTDDFSSVSGGFGFEFFRAMGVIWAGDEVSGAVSCTSDDASNPGSLTWLIVGREGNPQIDGLLGDVRIDFGQIEKIHTAGPIGSATLTPKIWAGKKIEEIRAIDAAEIGDAGPSTIAAVHFKADIQSGQQRR